MQQILLTYRLPKETVTSIMMQYRNTKVKVCSPDGDTDYFDIVAGVLQEYTLAPYLFIICLDYVLRTSIDKMKDDSFKLTKERSRRYPTHTITNADYANDIVLLANTPTQAKTLLHSLEWATAGIGLNFVIRINFFLLKLILKNSFCFLFVRVNSIFFLLELILKISC